MRYEIIQTLDGYYLLLDKKSEDYPIYEKTKPDNTTVVAEFKEIEFAILFINFLNNLD